MSHFLWVRIDPDHFKLKLDPPEGPAGAPRRSGARLLGDLHQQTEGRRIGTP